jgi:hypothetical protein
LKSSRHAGIAQLAEQLICNQQVAGSSPAASSNQAAGTESWLSGQKQQTVNLPGIALRRFKSFTLHQNKAEGLLPSAFRSGSNSVGRVTAFQAVGRGFESRRQLQSGSRNGELAERSKAADCKSAGHSPTKVQILHSPPKQRQKAEGRRQKWLCFTSAFRLLPSDFMGGSNSVGRVTAFQAVGRGFEPRLPLQKSEGRRQGRKQKAEVGKTERSSEGADARRRKERRRGVAQLR